MTATGLTFLPQPWQLTPEPDQAPFELFTATRIQISDAAGDTTRHAATTLQAALTDQTGLTLPLVPTGHPISTGTISLVLVGRDDETFSGEDFGWELPSDLGAQGYALRVTADGVTVAAADEAGLFYGAQTLTQLGQQTGRLWPALRVLDRPVLPNRGLMLDVSRMKVPTLETLLHLVTRLAHYKYNQFQLYTEHTFRFPSHPAIGADADPITTDDILALDAVCRAHHIELVPNFQSLGHQKSMLELPEYEHLSETAWHWSLATGKDETFEFLDELYRDLLPCFSSGLFNVNADEPYDMGLGQSKAMTDEVGRGRVYLHHIKRLHELVTAHGKQMMIWADMFWHHPDLIREFPDDIIMLDWSYEPQERFTTIEPIAEAGYRFYVCPGTSSWATLFPRLENAIANVQGFVRDGIAAGAEGMLMTDWGDEGHYQQLSHSWYAYLWAAECAWTGSETETADFEQAFSHLFLRDSSGTQVAALRQLGRAMAPTEDWWSSFSTPMALWEEPLAGRLADKTPPEAVAAVVAAAEALFPLLDQFHDPGIRHDLGFTVSQIRFACEKLETNRAAKALLTDLSTHTRPTDEGRERFGALLTTMRRQQAAIPAMTEEFERRWLAQARRSEIHVNLARFANLIAQYDLALAWLDAQRETYLAGGPIDSELATYDRHGYAILHEESYLRIKELADLVGLDNLPPDLRGWIGTIAPAA